MAVSNNPITFRPGKRGSEVTEDKLGRKQSSIALNTN
tara:strand:- start:385 stop:495 length:111 start_codon:yes stop_codon:yes gene_type:complete